MQVIEVIGVASGRSTKIPYETQDLQEVLLYWLRKKGITIASSCDGEGVCKKCVIQNGWLSCELTLMSFLNQQTDGKIRVDYL